VIGRSKLRIEMVDYKVDEEFLTDRIQRVGHESYLSYIDLRYLNEMSRYNPDVFHKCEMEGRLSGVYEYLGLFSN
jgi:hypothetical protein